MTTYKVLDTDGSACHGGTGKWNLPTQNADGTWTPGKWMPRLTGELVPCQRGYHLCLDAQVFEWFGPAIFEAEYRYKAVDAEDKIVVRQARLLRQLKWDERIARLLACDYAEHVLPIFEKECPTDNRPRACIETARRFTNGQATIGELTAAGSAARSAARDAAGSAAGSAAMSAADAARSAADAAWSAADAARSAARYAAQSAAQSAARYAEHDWQYGRLVEYLEGRL